VTVIDECPMKVWSASGWASAAIIGLASVWRHSCSVIGFRFSFFHIDNRDGLVFGPAAASRGPARLHRYSTSEATVGASVVPAFLAERQRGR
jgi:hypothetical protein